MKCPYCIKICSKCGKLLVANTVNFSKRQNGKLRNDCKKCVCERNKKHRQEHKDEYKQRDKERYEKKKNNTDYIAKRNEYNKKYKEEHKEESKEYYEKNKEKLLEYKKQWRENNPDKIFNYNNKRRQLEEEQGNGITKGQWLEMMNFFDWKCAYSGEYLGGKQNDNIRSIDHIIPLVLKGENEVWNCVPSHVFYNKSKHDKEMLEWYILQPFYSEERLNKIYEWIKYAEKKYKK